MTFSRPGQRDEPRIANPNLTTQAAASPTRIRLRAHTGFRAYDRNQLLMHEAFVHTLSGINAREQSQIQSMACGNPCPNRSPIDIASA